MIPSTPPNPLLIPTQPADTRDWILPDLGRRLLPIAAVGAGAWLLAGHPAWLGLSPGRLSAQLAFGLAGATVLFVAAAGLQLVLAPRRGSLKVPGSTADAALQAGYYALNAPLEEVFFRGLLQGGVGVLLSPLAGFAVGTTAYVLYHRLGGWAWLDLLAITLAAIPLGLAFWLLPGGPSLVGVTMAHFGATCGFLGPGPWLLQRLGLL
jgi:membrane protease YdiL (CAAX protease family)